MRHRWETWVPGAPPPSKQPVPSGIGGFYSSERSKTMGETAFLLARIETEGLDSTGKS